MERARDPVPFCLYIYSILHLPGKQRLVTVCVCCWASSPAEAARQPRSSRSCRNSHLAPPMAPQCLASVWAPSGLHNLQEREATSASANALCPKCRKVLLRRKTCHDCHDCQNITKKKLRLSPLGLLLLAQAHLLLLPKQGPITAGGCTLEPVASPSYRACSRQEACLLGGLAQIGQLRYTRQHWRGSRARADRL